MFLRRNTTVQKNTYFSQLWVWLSNLAFGTKLGVFHIDPNSHPQTISSIFSTNKAHIYAVASVFRMMRFSKTLQIKKKGQEYVALHGNELQQYDFNIYEGY